MDQFEAANEGDLQVLQDLLTRHNIDDVDDYGSTVLHNAASCGYIKCVSYCVDMHANLDTQDDSGWTALHSTSSEGYVDVACVLLNAGAMVNITNDDGKVPLHYASSN